MSDTLYRPADSDNVLLRKVLTRLNEGIDVSGVTVGDVILATTVTVKPEAGTLWKVAADAALPVTFSQPISVTPSGTVNVAGTVAVSNFPATQPVSGTVAVSNLPATQPVSGTVNVGNLPVTQPVSGSVAVSNFPATQPVSGTVAISGTVPVSGSVLVSSVTNPVTVASITNPVSIAGTVPVSGTVNVTPTGTVPVAFADSFTNDAFSRLRIAEPTQLFDAQMTYNIPNLVFETITNGSGAAVAHDATNRCATMTFASTPTGGKAFLQSYDYMRYQPGRSQEVFITFSFIETAANVLKFAGYSDGVNGIELQQDGSAVQLVLYSGTANGTQTVAKASWNIDKLDGTGISGKTLDLTKTQILVIDLQALYVGRVRVGFDIDGVIVPVHQFTHANKIAVPYIQSATLPLRCGMTCLGTVSTTMRFICASVSSNGGEVDPPGYDFTVEGSGTAGSGTAVHILSLRPKTLFNSIANRIGFTLQSIDLIVTGANPVAFDMVVGQAITGTTAFADVNTTHSAFEFNTAGTISGSPTLSFAGAYCAASNQVKQTASFHVSRKMPLTLNAAGAVRANGTLSVIATGIGGTSACRVRLNWREIR